ncbi:hypothetical protein ACHAXA_008049 [Cyclostephanos tholiformis]|uniref:Uncharacterized protein n=1 Tax=Cyclostephanos tholiformis TaxID=382380 RepID=A0ABD3R0N9_9STRA
MTALDHRALRYQNSKSYEELEDERLMDEAIDEMGTAPCPIAGNDVASRVNVEEQLRKEIRKVSDYLLEVHGMPTGRKGEGITRLIYENLNGLQSTLSSKNEKLEKARRVIDELQADVVCYNEHRQNLRHKANRNGFGQMFNGGEMELRAIASNNGHELDLLRRMKQWRTDGKRLILCLDANENIYRGELGRQLTEMDGLGMKEVVGDFTARQLGATYFRGSEPIDGIWATGNITVTNACMMPVGFGVGDHRLFVVDFATNVLAKKLAADAGKKDNKAYTAPEMCFQLGSARSVQTVHGANEGKHDNIPEPGVKLCPGTPASAAKPVNANQPMIEIASSEDDASSKEESEGSDDTSTSSDETSASASSVEDEQSALAGGR